MFSDEQHLLQLSSSAFAGESFILTDLIGLENLSAPFQFQLEAFASVDNLHIEDFLGQAANITISGGQFTTKSFNGLISKAEIGHKIANNLVGYKFTVAPWFWFLRYSKNHRRYENKTAIEIFTAVCHSLGFNDFDTSKLTKAYQPQKYVVQYNESDYDFLQRVLAEQGIQYYFSHANNSHTMVLVDSFNDFIQPTTAKYSSSDNQSNHIHDWQHGSYLTPHKITSSDYDYEKPTTNMLLTKATKNNQSILGQNSFEQFEFPGKYSDGNIGESKLQQKISASLAEKDMISASSNYVDFTPGFNFNLQDYPDSKENQQYLLLSVEHRVYDHSYLAMSHSKDELQQHYSNQFSCIASDAMAIPQSDARPAKVVGSQSSKIDGPTLGQLNSDTLGRVKTTHFWQNTDDSETTTHWCRTLQPVAGKSWGMQFIPRVGDEVLVRHLYGDPSQPLVIGSLHNAARLPYYKLPNEQTKSGFVSRSVGSDSTAKSHQLTFDDTKNKEMLSLISSKDASFSIKKDMSVDIQNTLTHHVTGKSAVTANKAYVVKAKQHISLSAGASSIKITPNEIQINGAKVLLHGSGGSNTSMMSALGAGSMSMQKPSANSASSTAKKNKPQKSFKVLSQLEDNISLQLGNNPLQSLPNSSIYDYNLLPDLSDMKQPLYLTVNGQQQKLFDDIRSQLNFDPYNDENAKIYITDAAMSEKQEGEEGSYELGDNNVVFLQAEHPMPHKLPDNYYEVDKLDHNGLMWLAAQVSMVNGEVPQALKDVFLTVNTQEKRQFLRDMMHGGKFRVQSVNGKSYVIFRGRNMTNVKSILGNRYRLGNTKIQSIRMAANTKATLAGDATAAAELGADALKDGALYFLVAGIMDIIHFYHDKNEDFSALLGHLAVDMAIGIPVVLAGIATGAVLAIAGIPALAVVLVSMGVSIVVGATLSYLDKKYHWSEKLGNKIRQGEQFIQKSPYLKKIQQQNTQFMQILLQPFNSSGALTTSLRKIK